MQVTYKGIEIYLNEDNGKFCFMLGKRARAVDSLAGAKRIIDRETTQAFDALTDRTGYGPGNGFIKVRIVGMKTRHSRYRGDLPEWVSDKNTSYGYVYKDTPEARKLLTEIHAMEMRHEKEYSELRKRHNRELKPLMAWREQLIYKPTK